MTTPAPRPANFRWQAFGIHLAISLLILGVLLWLLFYVWFPGYLFDTDGGWQALRIIVGVDLILGPLLTLVAANPRKPARELRTDLSLIGLLQVVALSAGTWIAHENRPVALLYLDGWFYSEAYSNLATEPGALAALARLPGGTPTPVFIQLPTDYGERAAVYRAAMERGSSVLYTPALYRPLADHATAVAGASRAHLLAPLDSPEGQRAQQAFLTAHGVRPEQVVWVPARSRYALYYLGMDLHTGRILGPLDTVRPPFKP